MASIVIVLLLVVLFVESSSGSSCEEGKWVFDESYPLYDAQKCSFIESREFDCLKNGRPDHHYLKYRWQPDHCNLPRFDGEYLLSRILRGKRLMFVGDSLSLNQWQSLTCMLHTALPFANYTVRRENNLSTFEFPEYDAKVMMSRNPFLVDIVSKEDIGRVLELDSISASATLWKGNHFLIFNTWHWWLHTGRKQPWDFVRYGNTTVKDLDRVVAYEKALTTWRKWVDDNIDPAKTKVLFQGISPDHANAKDWKDSNTTTSAIGYGCVGQTAPVTGSSYPAGTPPAELVLEKVLGSLSKPVQLLNVTRLSQLRIDGHPSFYGTGGHKVPDCSHWCLPGVPDTWNILLFAALANS